MKSPATPLICWILLFCLLVSKLPSVLGQRVEINTELKLGDGPDSIGTIRWTGYDFEGWNGLTWVSLTGGIKIGHVMDVDSNSYATVIIGEQEWMAQNLRTSRYRGGTEIDYISNPVVWQVLVSAAWCWFNNDPLNEIPYGKLYNWYVTEGDSVCPVGWHVPTESEFDELTTALGGESIAGGKMKETGTEHWLQENATNSSYFTALGTGVRTGSTGEFLEFNKRIHMRVTDDVDGTTARSGMLLDYSLQFIMINQLKREGQSIRCVKD